ncbi:hypothetical protein QQS21_000580 [Conoideocrella luteorostrata]|uniref:DUF7735 domain-containing protein n=1 Tax=Conoideocrella luteorostrata TaxID=1105319 RepID=A0AAJ0G2H5_9HYPO|nr:hypothetical protein QQS21_000580 [Conoideocrella luteorostrata]
MATPTPTAFVTQFLTLGPLDELLPTVKPTVTWEPWQCSTEMLPQYFDVPLPTGNLRTALKSYNDELIKDCEPTSTNVYGMSACDFPDASLWCAFTTKAPPTILPEFNSYASSASSWWSARSSKAVSLAHECPLGWYKAMLSTPAGAAWLNQTLIFGECYAEAHSTSKTGYTLKTSSASSSRG